MAKYLDYVSTSEDGIQTEIVKAQENQEARQDATPVVDWEQRYGELEKLNSRQAQTLGSYRQTIDQFITNPTPSEPVVQQQSPSPITVDELYEDPNVAVNKAIDNHPVVQEAREMKSKLEADANERALSQFENQHPDYQTIGGTPEFQNWVVEDQTRQNLYGRADQYDFSAADALFRLYKAENGLAEVQANANIAQAELVSSTGELVLDPPKYSRHEYINTLTRSKQGDRDAESWINANAAGYREALMNDNVRD